MPPHIAPLVLSAITVVSAAGRGMDATFAALRDRRGGLRPCDYGDPELAGFIGRVDGIEAHRLPDALAAYDCRNNRLADMALRADGFPQAVAAAVARHGAGRVGVVLGTSTSGVEASEIAYRHRDPATGALPAEFDFEHTHDLFSLARFVRQALGLGGPAMVVSTACASSARSFADASQLIAAGVCDAVVVGGADSLCGMTLHGFAALGLIAPGACRPCDATRDGISIGEAAGFALLERPSDVPDAAGRVALLGYGTTSDGYHMSAPHPQGLGAVGAMRQALARAGLPPEAIDYVALHGTGTRANDTMEDMAMAEVFGDAVPCASTKGWTGHTLGASGIVGAAIGCLAIGHGVLLGCLGVQAVDPAFRARVLTANQLAPVRRVMVNSFGFGGINCSLVLGLPMEGPA